MLRNDHAYIIDVLIPEMVKKANEDWEHYGDCHKELGIQGQFADIWRKVGPLKRALWEGETLTREQPREICMDLVGHLLLTVAMLDREDS